MISTQKQVQLISTGLSSVCVYKIAAWQWPTNICVLHIKCLELIFQCVINGTSTISHSRRRIVLQNSSPMQMMLTSCLNSYLTSLLNINLHCFVGFFCAFIIEIHLIWAYTLGSTQAAGLSFTILGKVWEIWFGVFLFQSCIKKIFCEYCIFLNSNNTYM